MEMHRDLDALLVPAIKKAFRLLREDGRLQLFAAFLDDRGVARLIKSDRRPCVQVAALSGAARSRSSARRSARGARGALFCAGVIQVMTDGTRRNAVQFHLDHVQDQCAHTITIPYLIDNEGQVRHGDHLFEETDDLLLARTAD